jgi:hypothetical protein
MFKLKVTVSSGAFVVEKKLLRKVLRQEGNKVAATARMLLRSKAGGGRVYGRHQASAPGEPPALLSGKLARSIVVRMFKSGEGVAIRSREFYALFLEKGAKGGGNVRGGAKFTLKSRLKKRLKGEGVLRQTASSKRLSTRVLEPRPFLDVALDRNQAQIGPRLRDAFVQGIAFRKGAKPR